MVETRFQRDLSLPGWVIVLAGILAFAPIDGRAEAGITAEAAGVAWAERIEVAAGNANRGPWRMNESNFDYHGDPSVAIDDAGRVGVIYGNNSVQDIFFQLYDAEGNATLDEPVNVSRSPDIFSWLPRVVMRSADELEVYILWQEIIFSGGGHGGEILFARSLDGGRTFSEPLNLSNTKSGAGKGRQDQRSWHNGSLDIAVTANGTLYAAWTEYEGPLHFSRSTDGGESFSEPLLVAGGEGDNPARGPALAVDPGGGINIAWAVGEDEAADIRFARSTDGGQSFSDPQVVHASDGHTDAPKMVADSKGILHLVYPESPEGRGGRYGLLYSRAVGDDFAFSEPVPIASLPDDDIASANFPSLQLDGDDNLYLTWELFPHPRRRPQGMGFTVSTDGGDSFADPIVLPESLDPDLGINGSHQGLLMNKLAVNTNGAIAAVNSTYRDGVSSHIWLFRGQLLEAD